MARNDCQSTKKTGFVTPVTGGGCNRLLSFGDNGLSGETRRL